MFYFPKNNVFGGPLLFSLQLRSLESLAVLETSKSEIPEAKVSTVILHNHFSLLMTKTSFTY